MKAKTLLATLLSLFAILATARAITFDEWREDHFTPAQIANPSIGGPNADPDGDHYSNFTEYVLGTDPWTAAVEPAATPTFTIDPQTSLPHFAARFKAPLDRQGILLMPQVVEVLGGRWRGDQIDISYEAFVPDGRYQFLAVDSVASNLPQHRFIRLLIAADSDEDGLPDDWEIAMGLNPNDPFDSMDDADNDGDDNFSEFLHGTNPHDASDNLRRDETPRAPRNAQVIYGVDGTRDLVWEDVSDNEQFFAIYAADANGTPVEIGRVGPNQTSFSLSATVSTISVGAGNGAGMSESAPAADPGAATNASQESQHYFKNLLTKPEIEKLQRLDLTRVKVTWKCAAPGVSPVSLVILRQAFDGDWERVHEQAWAASGTWDDPAADIAKIWRYAAITTYSASTDQHKNAGSDANPPKELDYGLKTYGILGRIVNQSDVVWSPPGRNLAGAAPRDDRFKIFAKSFDSTSPSFIPIDPALTAGQDAPPDFKQEGTRYYPDPEPFAFYTELCTTGYAIRGKPFTINASALIRESYEVCQLEFSPGYRTLIFDIGTVGVGNNKKARIELKDTKIELLGTRYEAPAEKGFDNVTYFACQHLPIGGGAAGSRPIKLLLNGTGDTPALTKTGPFALGGQLADEKKIDFSITASGGALDESGQVEESATLRKLKVVTLPAKSWTVGLYAVDIRDVTGLLHTAPNPPDHGTLEDALNNIYGPQANVTFHVNPKQQFELNFAQFTPPLMNYPATIGQMKAAMWTKASPKPDLAFFFVDQFQAGPTVAGLAFDVNTRGAVINRNGSILWNWVIPHELGHCMGLQHCWQPSPESPQTEIPDIESLRVMGYFQEGKLFRSKEIIKINKWDVLTAPLY